MEISKLLYVLAALTQIKLMKTSDWIGSWLGPRAYLDASKDRETYYQWQESNHGSYLVQVVAGDTLKRLLYKYVTFLIFHLRRDELFP